MLCPKCGSYMDAGAKVCPVCGARASANNPTAAPRRRTPTASTPDLPMKWFHFLIYFALWAGGILNILTSFSLFTGYVYERGELSAQLIYAALPQLKTVDTVYALLLFACGVFAIYTRYRLAGFKSNGPACLYFNYAATAAASLVYTVLTANIIGDPSLVNGTVTSVAGAVLALIFNRIYFQRRADLFVN